MALTNRQKVNIIVLIAYWGLIFFLSHIPIPKLVYRAQVSDKILHVLAYLILIFLLWFAISPNRRVDWRRATVWWILLVLVWYGAFDEWMQLYVGRQASVMDFLADISGVMAGLIVLSFFTFWPACLAVIGAAIFLLTNLAKTNPAELVPIANALFHLTAYSFFTVLWIRCIYHHTKFRPPQL